MKTHGFVFGLQGLEENKKEIVKEKACFHTAFVSIWP